MVLEKLDICIHTHTHTYIYTYIYTHTFFLYTHCLSTHTHSIGYVSLKNSNTRLFFCLWMSNFSGTICWKGHLSFIELHLYFKKISWVYLCECILDSMQFYWSICLSFCQYHSLLFFLFWPHRVACRTYLTRDQTRAPCTGSAES